MDNDTLSNLKSPKAIMRRRRFGAGTISWTKPNSGGRYARWPKKAGVAISCTPAWGW